MLLLKMSFYHLDGRNIKILLLLFSLNLINVEGNFRTVSTKQGLVKGYLLPEGIYGFFGIPYATAPTGKNRFKAPLPPPIFNDTFEAVKQEIACPQSSVHTDDENCLVAHIYTPNTDENNLPVLIYVHGGAFQAGAAFRENPRNFVRSKNVIVATFNYRLGAHGFLCLGTPNIPGNAGMKDQVAFLRWVNKNIQNFGGNPLDVTIYGSSAGARSVDLLLLSKTTVNLISSVIADSGSAIGISTVQVDPISNAKKFANMLGFTNVDDLNALEDFFLNASYELLTSMDLAKLLDYVLTPCVETDVGEEIFLHDSPFNILRNEQYPKIPILLGYTEMEGSIRLSQFEEWSKGMNEDFSNFLPHDLYFATPDEKKSIASRIKDFYFGKKVISENDIINYMNYFTDTMYVFPMLRSVQLHLKGNHDKIYLYEYSFTSEESPVIPYIDKQAAFHSIQSRVIFNEGNETELSREYQDMKTIMRDMWYNFMAKGQPVTEASKYPMWPPIRSSDMSYMSLNNTIELKTLQHRALFWNDIYDIYFRSPVPPPSYNGSIGVNNSILCLFLLVLFSVIYL